MNPTDIRTNKIKTWFILISFTTLVAGAFSTGIDAYWHIKIGEWIFNQQGIPNKGVFMYTHEDKPWVSHEWLSSLLLYLVFHNTGWIGIFFCTLFSLLLSLLLIFNFLLQRLDATNSRIFVVLSIVLLIHHILPRPHILALPILTYWTAKIIDASEQRSSPPFYILPLMILWANMHSSFLAGIVFSIFFSVEALFYAPDEQRKSLAYQWLSFIGLSVLFACLTPHGVNSLLLPFQLSNMKTVMSFIHEWQSPNFQDLQPLEGWLLFCLAVALTKGLKLPIFRLLFLLGAIHLSLTHQRYVPDLLSVLSPLVLATPIANQINSQKNFNLSTLLSTDLKGKFLLFIYFIILFFYLYQIKKIEPESTVSIHKVLNILKPEQENLGHVFNEYGLGGHLIYEGYDVFIDGRNEVYGDKFLSNYLKYTNLTTNIEDIKNMLKDNHIQWTVFTKRTTVNFYFEQNNDWKLLYSDNNIKIYLLKSVKISETTKKKLNDFLTRQKTAGSEAITH